MRRLAYMTVVVLTLGVVGGTSGATSSLVKPKAGDKFVALGSSIASGTGIATQEAGTSCARSDHNYAHLVAARYDLELVDVTCSASQVQHILTEPQSGAPPQIEAVTPDTKLITITTGGNDIGYNLTAVLCGNPANVCTAPATLQTDIENARTALADMIDQLEAAAPKATIVFVTYPREVPRKGNCPELGFTDGEAEIVRSIGKKLEKIFVDVVKKRKDVVFVDPYVAKGDHTGCAPEAQRWTAGNVAENGFQYHPTALGHEIIAKMIFKALKKH